MQSLRAANMADHMCPGGGILGALHEPTVQLTCPAPVMADYTLMAPVLCLNGLAQLDTLARLQDISTSCTHPCSRAELPLHLRCCFAHVGLSAPQWQFCTTENFAT